MTGLDALGPPGGNKHSNKLGAEAVQNRLMPEVERRLWMREGELGGESGGTLGDVLTLGGAAPAIGKGIVESNLALIRGAHWLGSKVGMDFGVEAENLPKSIYDLMPEEAGQRLASRLGSSNSAVVTGGEVVGAISTLLPGTGAGKAISGPGIAIRGLGWPGAKIGEKLAQIPQVAAWAKTANALPQVLGGATGFGLYNLITTDGDMEARIAAGLHGMVAGGVLAGFGKLASSLEAKILDKTLTAAQADRVAKFLGGLKNNKIPTWEEAQSLAKIAGAKGAAAMVEGLGFAGLDKEFWSKAAAGDPDAIGIYAGSVAGALLARTGNREDYLTFRRMRPEMNTAELRREILDIRRAQSEKAQEPQDPQKPSGPGKAGIKGFDQGVEAEAAKEQQLPAKRASAADPAVETLLRSGWEIPEGVPPDRVIEVEYPGGGKVKFTEGSGGYTVEVPIEVFTAVRGKRNHWDTSKMGPVVMEGAVAEEFARDLAAVTMMRRMGGEIALPGEEAWAGGPWKGEDGKLYTIGIDGETYSRSWPHEAGEEWQRAKSRMIDLITTSPDPSIQRWMDLSGALRQTATPNPGLDLIETSVLTAINGNPESRSVQELNRFLSSLDPDQLAQILDPKLIEDVGMVLGRVGSGHSTAEAAMEEMGLILLTPPQADAQQAEQPAAKAGEEGFVDVGAVGGALANVGGRIAKRTRQALDYTMQTQAETVRKAMPSDTLSYEGRKSLSRERTLRGEAAARWRPAENVARKLGRKWRDDTVKVSGGAGEFARWERLADRRSRPQNEDETLFVSAIQDANKMLYEAGRRAGLTRGQLVLPRSDRIGKEKRGEHDSKTQFLPRKDWSVVQRFRGKDEATVMGDAEMRRAWFELLESLNPDSVTAEGLEKRWDEANSRKTKTESVDVDSALEHARNLREVPHWFNYNGKRYEMRLSNPYEVMRLILDKQPATVASQETWGSDLTQEQRNQLAKTPDAEPSQLESLNKPGPEARLAEWKRRLFKDGSDAPTDEKNAAYVTAQNWMETVQGGRPIKQSTTSRIVQDLTVTAKAAMTAKAPLYDIPELLTQPAIYAGLVRALMAHKRIWQLGGPKAAVEFYRRLGAIPLQMGDMIWEESSHASAKAASALGVVGTMTENFKAAVVAATADVLLDSWKAGHGHAGDALTLSTMRLSPEDQISLLDGKFDDALARQFRDEFVQMLTGRGERGEMSALVDNQNVMPWLYFVRFASGRAIAIRKAVEATSESIRENGVWSKKAMRAAGRLGRMGFYNAASGLAQLFMRYWLTAMLQRDEQGGLTVAYERMGRELGSAPVMFTIKALANQTVGGPAASMVDAVANPNDVRKWAGLTVPGNILFAGAKAIEAANRGDASFMLEFLGQAGYIPLFSDAKKLYPKLVDNMAAVFAGEVLSKRRAAIEDRQLAWEWKTKNVERGILGLPLEGDTSFPRSKTARFYDYVGDAMKEFYRGAAQKIETSEQVEEGLDRARAYIEKALTLDDVKPESVAGYIRSQRHFSGWSDEDQVKFLDYVGDDKRVSRMIQHDLLLDHLARKVGQLEGQASDVEADIQNLRRLAALGGGNWRGVIGDIVGRAASEMDASGTTPMEHLTAVSSVLASNADGIREVFSGRYAETLLTYDHAKRVLNIRSLLLKRAKNQKVNEFREEARGEK